MRTSTLDFYVPESAQTTEYVAVELVHAAPGVEAIAPKGIVTVPLRDERVATGFPFTEGPV